MMSDFRGKGGGAKMTPKYRTSFVDVPLNVQLGIYFDQIWNFPFSQKLSA